MHANTLLDIANATNGLQQEIIRLMQENDKLKTQLAKLTKELAEAKK